MKNLMATTVLWQQTTDVIGKIMKNLLDTTPYRNIFEKDSNNRSIDLFRFNNIQSYGDGFYPNCFFKCDDTLVNFSTEKVMSLKDVELSLSEEENDVSSIEESPVFYFVYNTDNYYHFIYDTLPYLISYFKIRESVPNIKLLMNYPNTSGKMYRFVSEFLDLLNIKEDQILILDKGTIYREAYVSTSYTHGHDSNLPPRREIYEFYNAIVENAIDVYSGDLHALPKNIYVSRRTWMHGDTSNIGTNYTTRRKLEEEDELVEMLVSEGVEEVFAEKLSTIEKIVMFNNADVVIGSIGGGLCNVLFSKQSCQLLCIVSPTFLSINNRFRYCFERVRTFYYENTSHSEDDEWKKWMRVKSGNIIGEVEDVLDEQLIVSYTDEAVAGWNNNIEYKKIKLNKKDCVALDNGLNSSWKMNLVDFYEYKNNNILW